jgi:ABC-2 type transport system ATP-binding protein
MERAARKKRAGELLETVGMTNWADSKVGAYSKGMMQRVGVAAALVNDPELVILDEPTDGVDPVGRREIREVLEKMKGEGRTVFVNSHLLSELELISDRVAILVGGRVVSQGTLNELTIGRQFFEMEVVEGAAGKVRGVMEGRLGAKWGAPPGADGLVKGVLGNGLKVEAAGAVVRIESTDVEAAQVVIDGLRAEGVAIRRMQQMRPSLEDLFVEAVGGVGGGHNAGAVVKGGAR